jgi:hydrogenase maturation protease
LSAAPLLVLAIGNPLRRDDGAAARAAPGLEAEGLRGLVLHQPRPELALEVAGARAVVFLDAREGGRAGEVLASPVLAEPRGAAQPHAVSPAEVMALAERLWGARPPAALVTVTGRDFGFGEGLSPEVEAALPALRAAALGFLRGGAQNLRDQVSVKSTSGAFES